VNTYGAPPRGATGACLNFGIGYRTEDYRWAIDNPALHIQSYNSASWVDSFTIGINGVDTTYNFEAPPLVAVNTRGAADPIIPAAKDKFRFQVFGKVLQQDFGVDSFLVDDGSGQPVRVKAKGHGLSWWDGLFALAKGTLDPATTPYPTLSSSRERVTQL